MKTHHVCYEGTLACSGCNPCVHCQNVVNHEVLAQAMRRTTEVITQARGPKGTVAVEELDTKNFWAIFYGFYGQAWQSLHAAMMADPKVQERAYDLRAIPGFVETGRYVAPVLPSLPLPSIATAIPVVAPAVPAAPPIVPLSVLAAQAPAPFAPLPTAPTSDPASAWSAAFELRENAALTTATIMDVPADAKPPVQHADIRRTLTADDIAASATVLEIGAAPASSNGVAAHD